MASALTKTWQNSITTPLPADVLPERVTEILHDHGFLITMSPIVTRYEKTAADATTKPQDNSGPGGDEKVSYKVWETISFGLFSKEITFNCAFQNMQSGVISWIHAPMGLTSQATYTVKQSSHKEGPAGWFLEENIESSCNVILKSFVEKTMVSTREKMHARILEKAGEKGSGDQGGSS